MFDAKLIEKIETNFNIDLSFLKRKNRGGNGGQVFIYATKEARFEGGEILAIGGDGEIAGDGGKVIIKSPKIIGEPNISVDGGNATL